MMSTLEKLRLVLDTPAGPGRQSSGGLTVANRLDSVGAGLPHMTIQLNGRPYEMLTASTVRALLDLLEYPPLAVAVQINDVIVPRARYADTLVQDGDQVEVITFAAGG
jgi:sulfur carrier protein